MANTATKVSSSPNHLTYLLQGDGTVAGPTIANATILNDCSPGPLRDAWDALLGTQARMRAQLLGGQSGLTTGSTGSCFAIIQQLVQTGFDITATVNQVCADVDTDAVTSLKAEINIGMSDTAAQTAMLHLIHRHGVIQ